MLPGHGHLAGAEGQPEGPFVTVDPTGSMVWIRPDHLQPPPRRRSGTSPGRARRCCTPSTGRRSCRRSERRLRTPGDVGWHGRPRQAGSREGQSAPEGVGLRWPTGGVDAAEPSQRQLQRHGRDRRGHAQAGFKVDVQPLDWGRCHGAATTRARSTPQAGNARQQGRLEPVRHRRHGARCLDAAHQCLPRHAVPQRCRRLPLRRGPPASAPQLVGEHRRSRTRASPTRSR